VGFSLAEISNWDGGLPEWIIEGSVQLWRALNWNGLRILCGILRVSKLWLSRMGVDTNKEKQTQGRGSNLCQVGRGWTA
jgi:hypothetical protein